MITIPKVSYFLPKMKLSGISMTDLGMFIMLLI